MPREIRLPKTNLTAETLLTSHEVAHYTQFNPSSINKWVKEERIPAFRTPGGHRRIKVADLVLFLVKHKMPVPPALRPAGIEMAMNIAAGGTALETSAPIDPLEKALKNKPKAKAKKGAKR